MSEPLRFSGIMPANILPFAADLSIDEPAYRRHLAWLAGTRGVTGIVANGHAAEVSSLTRDERRRALALAPDRPNPHNNLALALASARRFDEALPHFREAIRLEPANYELRINLASALSAAGKDAESLEQYEAAARLAREAGRSDIAQAIIDGVRRMTQRRDP